MARILVTGATGWVGSVVCSALTRRGHDLALVVRGGHGRGLGRDGRAADVVLDGDVTRPGVGVGSDEIARLRGSVDLVLHLAASVRLDAAAAPEVRAVNVDGTRNVLALAEALASPRFCMMSSCAVAGDAAALMEDELDVGQGFHNEYERSKMAAEVLVRGFPGRAIVLRMSGLVGDARTGATSTFAGAFYRVAAAYWSLAEELHEQARRGSGELAKDGIFVDRTGLLHLPAHVPHGETARCQVVPQDWLAEVVADVLEHGDASGTYHLVHPAAPPTGWALGVTLARLGIARDAAATSPSGAWARLVRRSLERTIGAHQPYLMHTPKLSCARLPRLLGERRSTPPTLDEPLLARLVDFGVRHRFWRVRGEASW